jgi:hypothetical protein
MPFSDGYPQELTLAISSQTQIDQDISKLSTILSTMNGQAKYASMNKERQACKTRINHGNALSSHPSSRRSTPLQGTSPSPSPKLPQELLDMIWEYALPGPRVVPFYLKRDEFNNGLITCPLAPPVMLHVCRASRQIALKHGFEPRLSMSSLPAPRFVNFTLDTVYLDDSALIGEYCKKPHKCDQLREVLRSVKKLAIGSKWDMFWDNTHSALQVITLRNMCWDLKEIYLAAFISDEWLPSGNVAPLSVTLELVPQLEILAFELRQNLGMAAQRNYCTHSDVDVGVRLVDNATCRAWAKEGSGRWTEIR